MRRVLSFGASTFHLASSLKTGELTLNNIGTHNSLSEAIDLQEAIAATGAAELLTAEYGIDDQRQAVRAFMYFRGDEFKETMGRVGIIDEIGVFLAHEISFYTAARQQFCLYDVAPQGLSAKWRAKLFQSVGTSEYRVTEKSYGDEVLAVLRDEKRTGISGLSFGNLNDVIVIGPSITASASADAEDYQMIVVPKTGCAVRLRPEYDNIWFDVENKAMLVQEKDDILLWGSESIEPTRTSLVELRQKNAIHAAETSANHPVWWYSERHLMRDRSGSYFQIPHGLFQPEWKEVDVVSRNVIDADLKRIVESYFSKELKTKRIECIAELNLLKTRVRRKSHLLLFLQAIEANNKPEATREFRGVRLFSTDLRLTLPDGQDGGELIRDPIKYLSHFKD